MPQRSQAFHHTGKTAGVRLLLRALLLSGILYAAGLSLVSRLIEQGSIPLGLSHPISVSLFLLAQTTGCLLLTRRGTGSRLLRALVFSAAFLCLAAGLTALTGPIAADRLLRLILLSAGAALLSSLKKPRKDPYAYA